MSGEQQVPTAKTPSFARKDIAKNELETQGDDNKPNLIHQLQNPINVPLNGPLKSVPLIV